MDVQRLEERIRGRLNHFPTKTRRVAEYILANSSEVAFHSISETAEKLSVSRAQLVRVARMLGFEGYADLKNTLKHKLMTQVIPSSLSVQLDGKADNTSSELCRLEQANIEETCKNLNMNRESISEFCKTAQKSDVIYCMGWGISSLPAEWLYTRFSELGLKSVLMRRGSLSLLEQSRGIRANDMLIVCELPSYVIEVTEAVEKISQRNTAIASITDSPAAPVCSYSGMHFYVSDHSPLFGSSLIGSMFAVHVLTSILAQDMGLAGRQALEAQKEGLTDQRVYYPSYGLRY
ncbi:MAG: MurR/RpiR family transcriptional regulator [Synergistaceae bacterium]|nr:MurR/RpiR family transcriptional regulator [Synergistaceae bacterium]